MMRRRAASCSWTSGRSGAVRAVGWRPTVDALATEFDGRATVAKLNVDENPTIPERYAVRGIPTLLLFKEGELTETIVGLRGKEDIAKMIERHLGA